MTVDSLMISQFEKMHPQGRALVVTHDHIQISQKIIDMGIWVCQECASFNPIENRYCKSCSTEKFIIKKQQL